MRTLSKTIRARYPDARLTGLSAFFELLREESSWRPDPVNKDLLIALGIAKGKESNTIFALQFLGIINEGGSPTNNFDRLKDDFQPTLKELVLTSYAPLFQAIPRSRVNEASLVRFFQTNGYTAETAEYQAKLFVHLCQSAAIDLPAAEKTFKRARFHAKPNQKSRTAVRQHDAKEQE